MKIFVKQLYDDKGNKIPITLPKKGSEVAAGYDIVATSDPKIVGEQQGDKWKRIDYIEYETNLYIAPSAVTFHTLIHPRSSVSKYNLVLANSIGLVDNDYRGMVICRFKYVWQPEDLVMEFQKGNFTDEYARTTGVMLGKVNIDKIYDKGEAIAQLVIEPTVMADFELVDDLTKTQRGEGGFGSTDLVKVHPKHDVQRVGVGKPLIDMYNESGGVSVKEKYSEEIRRRDAGT